MNLKILAIQRTITFILPYPLLIYLRELQTPLKFLQSPLVISEAILNNDRQSAISLTHYIHTSYQCKLRKVQ